MVGRTRLALAAMENHWWQCTLYVTERLVLRTAKGETRRFSLEPQTVARFYEQYLEALLELRFAPRTLARPVEMEKAIPFAED